MSDTVDIKPYMREALIVTARVWAFRLAKAAKLPATNAEILDCLECPLCVAVETASRVAGREWCGICPVGVVLQSFGKGPYNSACMRVIENGGTVESVFMSIVLLGELCGVDVEAELLKERGDG
jgi:hypothetical protein